MHQSTSNMKRIYIHIIQTDVLAHWEEIPTIYREQGHLKTHPYGRKVSNNETLLPTQILQYFNERKITCCIIDTIIFYNQISVLNTAKDTRIIRMSWLPSYVTTVRVKSVG